MKRVLITILAFVIISNPFIVNNAKEVEKVEGKLIFFSIGVNCQAKEYDDYAPDLLEISNEFVRRGMTTKYENHLILGHEATRPAVIEGLQWLSKNTGPLDTVLFYIAAHGKDEGGYSFCTNDHKKVWGSEIKEYLSKLTCNVIMIIDTCHSGAFVRDWPNMKDNMMAIASCRPEEYSWDWYFYRSLMEALTTMGDVNNDGVINADEIIQVIPKRLAQRINIQHMFRSEKVVHIPLLKT